MATNNHITLVAFYEELEAHPWAWSYAGEYRPEIKKQYGEKCVRLRKLAEASKEHKALHDAYTWFAITGKDKPARPAPEPTPTPAFNLRNLTALVSGGKVFSVEFVKRSTGELRKMNCRLGVKKHLKGGVRAYEASAKGLLTVFDMQSKGYRSIPVEAIKTLSVSGQSFNFAGA